MITKNNDNETNMVLSKVERKEWRQPKISKLNVKDTKGGDNAFIAEVDWNNLFYNVFS